MGKKPSRERLVKLYHERDMTQEAVGDELDVSSATVAKWLREEDIETRKPRDTDLKDDLRRVAQAIGKTPSFDQYREHGEYGANTVKRRFDGWNAAKEAAGLDPNTERAPKSEQQLIDALQELAEELGKSPTQAEINEHTPHSHKTYYRRFDGGLSEAKKRAGLTPNQAGERVTVECANCGGDLERLQSDVAEKENVFCSEDCLAEYRSEKYSGEDNPAWNSVQVACEVCDDEMWRDQWDVDNKKTLLCSRECYAEWRSERWSGEDHPQWVEYPTVECEWCGAPFKVRPANEDSARFCSWECTNSWKSEEYQTEGNKFKYMGRNWPEQREKTLIRDQARCRDCGLTEPEHVAEYGCGLEVHHIEPREEHRDEAGVLDWKNANRLENLITYCKPCHSAAESG